MGQRLDVFDFDEEFFVEPLLLTGDGQVVQKL